MKKNLIVLLSETEVTNKQVRFELEKSEEFHPYFAYTEGEFVRMLNRIAPDLVVLDDAHPSLSIEKALSLLRKYRTDVPFVILSESEQQQIDAQSNGTSPLTIQTILPQAGHQPEMPAPATENSPDFNRLFFETTSDLIWGCHTDGTVIYINGTTAMHFGYELESLTGKNLFSLVHPEDQRKFKSAFKDWVIGIAPCQKETFRVRQKNGQWHIVRILGAYCLTHLPPLNDIYIIAKDVSEESHRDDWLQNVAPTLLDRLASDADHAFIIIDRSFKVRAFNRLAKEWSRKFSGKELQKGHSIYDYIFDKAIGKFNERVEQALKGIHVIYENNVSIPGGGELRFELHYVPVLDKAGKVLGVSLNYYNIKQNDEASAELEASRQYFRALVKATSDITIILKSTGIIDHVSFSSEPILGYKPAQLAGQNIFDYLHPDDPGFLKKAVQQALLDCDDKVPIEFRFRNQAASWVYLDATVECLSTDSGFQDKIVLHAKNKTEQKQIEDALKVRNKAIEASLNGIIITDATQKDNPIVYVNPAFEKMTGYIAHEVIGKNPRFLHGTDLDQPAIQKFREAVQSGSSCKAVLRNYRKDGTLIWNEVMVSPIINERGILTNFIGIKSDVTERVLADEQLLQTNRLLTAISEIQSAFIADMEPGTLFKSILDKLLLLTGSDYGFIGELSHDVKNGIGIKIYSMQDSAERLSNLITCNLNSKSCQKCGKLFSICTDIIATNQPFIGRDIELDNKHACLPQASSRIENLLGLPLFSGEELIGIAITVKKTGRYDDALAGFLQPFLSSCGNIITAYRSNERHLMAEERVREQAALLDITEEAILVRDLAGRILFWNHGSEKLYGWTAEEAIGKKMSDLIVPHQEDDGYKEAETEVLTKGSWSGELNQVTKSGDQIVIESNWTLMPNKDGKPKSFLIVTTDVTAKKRFEAHLLRTQRMEAIGRLASGIAHDLNNVLSPIILSMQILKKRTTDVKIRSLISTLENSAHRGANLVKRLLSFARGTEGERVPLQIKHQLDEIFKLLKQTFPKNININIDVPKNLWLVHGDATQMHQVLLNLCVNSRDAMEAFSDGTLSISASNVILDEMVCRINPEAQPGRYLKLSVSDTGSGIPPEILDNIYEPFFTTKDPGRGTGIGLSTVFSIVKSHNGFITVYSEVGKGTAFNIYLPAAETTDEQINEVLYHDYPQGNGEVILIADDEAIIREVAKEALESSGYQVVMASDGGDAVSQYIKHSNKINAVLLDVMMPNVDGFSCLQALKKLDPDIRIILTSGLSSNKALLDHPVATNCIFLEKPFTVETLIKTLQEILSA